MSVLYTTYKASYINVYNLFSRTPAAQKDSFVTQVGLPAKRYFAPGAFPPFGSDFMLSAYLNTAAGTARESHPPSLELATVYF
ncbi:hypothetical protein DESAMIL20_1139 [Desulfurella amilsii]|uniref:Uncharacterized protein n=1 Tax=Desulfurella amilsii TaxID=1562698 RepID=A0A1X4XVL3_9BACT|nr:hypothetical protein DESAMIL20_1139 [Desulfurella amilsii]